MGTIINILPIVFITILLVIEVKILFQKFKPKSKTIWESETKNGKTFWKQLKSENNG